jgi:hypothetical protein
MFYQGERDNVIRANQIIDYFCNCNAESYGANTSIIQSNAKEVMRRYLNRCGKLLPTIVIVEWSIRIIEIERRFCEASNISTMQFEDEIIKLANMFDEKFMADKI